MYAEERQQAVVRLVTQRRRVAVSDLAAEFRVTTETVRRDLSLLEKQGLVRRVHGGVVPADALVPLETGLSERDHTRADLKDRIARAALALLPGTGGSVLLDAGSTTARLADALALTRSADHRLVVHTHAVPLAARLVSAPQVDLHVLPGRVRTATGAGVGADTVLHLQRLRADVALLGTNALSPDHGASTPDADEAAVKRALVGAAHRVVVLADSSKLGRQAGVRFADLAEIDDVVTDDGVEAADVRWLEDAGVEVHVA
ncbi:DeoR/GlpR family DNA-binding transcription regulator [Nocardioides sp.]|uniref:DeoR/GlpR family DNA-binding transcription regulator n=1 Tax=Nocardioides sp. TaxID=35761 RepID=UPI0035141468